MHNRKLIRLSGFDYSANRNYFFTICVQDHLNTFGSIVNKSMLLSNHGIIAFEQWYWLHDQYPYIDLISFVVMPDHVHGIIFIDTDFYKHCLGNGDMDNVGNGDMDNVGNGDMDNVGNGRDRSLQGC